jgi:hypothetical protein
MNFCTFPKDSLAASAHIEDTLIKKPWNFCTESYRNEEQLKT